MANFEKLISEVMKPGCACAAKTCCSYVHHGVRLD